MVLVLLLIVLAILLGGAGLLIEGLVRLFVIGLVVLLVIGAVSGFTGRGRARA